MTTKHSKPAAPAAPAPEAAAPAVTEVTHTVIDNTFAEETPEVLPEVTEIDLGDGTVQVNYR